MADAKKGGGPEKPRIEEEPILARLTSGATLVPGGLTSFVGLLGRSSKEGSWLLFLTLDMTVSVEIRGDDIVHSEQLPPDKSPFGSLGGTRVFVKKDAEVTTIRTFSRTRSAAAAEDEFDLDIRLGRRVRSRVRAQCRDTSLGTTCMCEDEPVPTPAGSCESCEDTCGACTDTCGACVETRQATCTCHTQCGQSACHTCYTQCGQTTCLHTQCGQGTCNTCQTCHTQCGQGTCNTCHTDCGQGATCKTCPGETCGGGCTRANC